MPNSHEANKVMSIMAIACLGGSFRKYGVAPRGRSSGFTLLELLIVVSIIAVTTIMVVPNAGDWLNHVMLGREARLLRANLQLARFHAIKEAATYKLCTVRSSGPATANGDCYTGSTNEGYGIYRDRNGNDVWDSGTDDPLVWRTWGITGATASRARIYWSSTRLQCNGTGSAIQTYGFDPAGRATVNSSFQVTKGSIVFQTANAGTPPVDLSAMSVWMYSTGNTEVRDGIAAPGASCANVY